MKTLQLTKFYPPVLGGIESVSYELVEGLNAIGIPTDVLCANIENHTVRETHEGGYSVVRAASWVKLLSTSIAPSLIHELRMVSSSYDIVHIQLPNPMANLALWFARPRARIVLHWQSDIINQPRTLQLYAPLQNWLLRRADAIIATSEAYANSSPWLRAFEKKVRVIPLGMRDPEFDDIAASKIRRVHAGKKLVFSLGRMTYYKGFNVLIDAVPHLPDDFVVVVGGGGELLEGYRALVAERGLTERIRFVGPLGNKEAKAYMRACDVFCLPSTVRTEAFGMVLLEAMAAQRPIVATFIAGSGVPWVAMDGVTGNNAAVDNPLSLAQALQKTLDSPSGMAKFGAAARERFETLFSAERMISDIAALYEEVMRVDAREGER